MGCLKLPHREKDDRPNFLAVWKKSAGKENCKNYYPFGLTFNSFNRENSVHNQYLYNKGSERQDELDLNVDFTRFRMYDPAMGRWWQVDPLAADVDDLLPVTPYNYSFNNPVRYNDPEGDCPCFAIPIIIEAVAALTTAELVTGAAVAAGGATVITFGDRIWDAMGNASPYITPAVQSAQQGGGAKSLNSNSKKQVDQEATKRGRENEKKALKDEGLNKNNETKTTIDPKTGKEVKVKHDGENETTIGEVKDTKTVSNTRQVRGEREVARQQGKEFKIITGDKTKVYKTIPEKEIVRKPYLGPQK